MSTKTLDYPTPRDRILQPSQVVPLPQFPLGALLPKLGNLTDLYEMRDNFSKNLDNVQKDRAQAGAEKRPSRLPEELMLTQILQWLSINDGVVSE